MMQWQGWSAETVARAQLAYPRMTRLRLGDYATNLVVADRVTDELLGFFSVDVHPSAPVEDTLSLGWWLAPQARGKGLAHESLRLALDYVHTELLLDRILMGTSSTNIRAMVQIERSGATHVADHPVTLPDLTIVDGRWFLHERTPS